MAKRTGNSSVNSSIREGTKTQGIGLSQLLELQKITNSHLGSIANAIIADSKKITELTAVEVLSSLQQKKTDKTIIEENDSLNAIEESQKELVRLAKTDNERAERTAASIATMAQSMKTFKTLGEKLGDMKKGFADKFGKGNIGRTALSALNVGGLLDKKIAQGDFVKQQKLLGSTASDKELKANFAGAQKASKNINANEKEIEKFKKDVGGAAGALTDEQMATTERGKELLATRQVHTEEYAKHDKRAAFAKEETSKSKKSKEVAKSSLANAHETEIPIKLDPKPPVEVAKENIKDKRNTALSKESKSKEPSSKIGNQQIFLLKQIVTNTKPIKVTGTSTPNAAAGRLSPAPQPSESGGGMLSEILSFISDMLMTTLKSTFSLKNMLKFLGKIALPAMIIGSLVNGLMDGFKVFSETGSISEAIVAGLGGILSFLTFGLFDADTLKTVIKAFSGFVNDYIIEPVQNFFTFLGDSFKKYIVEPLAEFLEPLVNFFKNIKDQILSMVESIGIPEMSFTIPVIGTKVSIGPFYPFKKESTESTGTALPSGNSDAGAGRSSSEYAATDPRRLDIPQFKEGGIATEATVGNFGEAGPEALIPLTKLGDVLNPEVSTLSPEQLEYNRLRAQLDGLDSLRDSGSKNVYEDRDPSLDTGEARFRAALVKMEESLKAKGIDARAEYDAPEPGDAPKGFVDLASKYKDDDEPSVGDSLYSKSAENAEIAGKPMSSNIISAPTVNNNVKQTAISKVISNVRTNESSVDRYISARAVY